MGDAAVTDSQQYCIMTGNEVNAAVASINAAGVESTAVIEDGQGLTKRKASDAKGQV
jgi:hypothetical protein